MDVLNGIINEYLGTANEFLYSKFLIIALILSGLYFTVRTKFVQIRMLPDAFRAVTEKSHKGGVSSFQALMIATASRVGTGNIAGVTTALVSGGAGAVFWMWVMCIIGAASAFVESTLAQVYKVRDGEGYKGGPAYYIQHALKARWLGIIFAVLLILTFALGFNGLQSFNTASALDYYHGHWWANKIFVGTVLAVAAGFLFFSRGKISIVSSIIVPIMAIIYIIMGTVIIITNFDKIGTVFGLIIDRAFDFKAIFGGFAGSCIVIGIKRGLFSNEAGMGSAPNAAASADVSHPAKQGLVQVLSVYIDTILLCSTTAFIILLPGVIQFGNENLTGMALVQASIETAFGKGGIAFITLAITLFAFSSLIGNYFYAEANIKFISENKIVMFFFRILAIAVIFIGAQVNLETAWNLSDVIMGCMATINIIAILLLGGIACRVLKDFVQQKKEGRDPVFKAARIGLNDTELWK